MPKPMKFTKNTGPMKKRKPFIRRKNETPDWDYRYLHQYNEAVKISRTWGAQGQGKWSQHWEIYAQQLLKCAKGEFLGKKTPVPPKCLGSTQQGSPYIKPGHLQGIHI